MYVVYVFLDDEVPIYYRMFKLSTVTNGIDKNNTFIYTDDDEVVVPKDGLYFIYATVMQKIIKR